MKNILIFGNTLDARKNNINHNSQQCILIHGTDDKADIRRRAVAVENRTLAISAIIAEWSG